MENNPIPEKAIENTVSKQSNNVGKCSFFGCSVEGTFGFIAAIFCLIGLLKLLCIGAEKSIENYFDAKKYEKRKKIDAKYRKEKNIETEQTPAQTVDDYVPSFVEETADAIRNRFGSSYESGQLLGKLIYKGDIVIIYGCAGVGKSTFTIQIAKDLASGKPSKLLIDNNDGRSTPQNVLYYDGEMDSADYQKILGDANVNVACVRFSYVKRTEDWIARLNKRLENCKTDTTVILDNISCVCSSMNGESIREFFLKHLKQVQQKFEDKGILTFIILAHSNKENDMMGSVHQKNFATTVIRLNKHDDEHITMSIEKNRKYGEMANKTFLLKKMESSEGYKHFENKCLLETDTESDICPNTADLSLSLTPPISVWNEAIPIDVMHDIDKYYKKGVQHYGLDATIKKFKTDQYGIKHSTQLSRLLKSYKKYKETLKEDDTSKDCSVS